MLEVRSVYLNRRKGSDGKEKKTKNPKGRMILFAVLYIVILISIFFMCLGIGSALIPADLAWLYFTITNILAFLVGIIGSVLSTAQALFRSTDNEFLLAMPIPASRIIFVRMISVFLMSLLYVSMIMIPAVIYYFIAGSPSVLSVIFCILGIFVMTFLVTAFSCGAGWLVSFISTKLKNQKIILTFLLVVAIGGLYYFQFNASRIINSIIANAETIAASLKGWGYFLYAPALGMTGQILDFLLFLGITGLLFAIAYLAVTKSFSRIALFKAEEKHTVFRKETIRVTNIQNALLKREFKRFFASIAYMFNAGLGCVILLILAVLAMIKMQDIRTLITKIGSGYPQIEQIAPVLAACAVCILASFCVITGCSISMEGKYLWVCQSLPVDPYAIFRAKILLHVILTGVPALLLVLALGIILQTTIPVFLCMVVFVIMFIYLIASFGLRTDLKHPKLSWTNETQAIKTNMNVLVIMLIGFLVPAALCGLYFLLQSALSPALYLVILFALSAALSLLVHRWLAGSGREIFRYLS